MKYDFNTEIESNYDINDITMQYISKIISEIQKKIKIIPGTIKPENLSEPIIFSAKCENKENIEMQISTFQKGTVKIYVTIKGKNRYLYIDFYSARENDVKINGYKLFKDGIYFMNTNDTDNISISFYDINSIKYVKQKWSKTSIFNDNLYNRLGIIPDREENYSIENKNKINFAVNFYNGILPKKKEEKVLELKKDND